MGYLGRVNPEDTGVRLSHSARAPRGGRLTTGDRFMYHTKHLLSRADLPILLDPLGAEYCGGAPTQNLPLKNPLRQITDFPSQRPLKAKQTPEKFLDPQKHP